jgi:hypothetical protein
MTYQPYGAPHRTPPRRRGLRATLIAAIAVVVIAAAIAVTLLLTHPGNFEAEGTMSVADSDTYSEGYAPDSDQCATDGLDGYDDVVTGTQVVVRDDAGNTVAVGDLNGAKATDVGCDYIFHLSDVPAGKKFYEVEVGSRGGVQYTEEELREGVGVELGD